MASVTDFSNFRVLVVDDSRTLRRILLQELKSLGIENVVQAADGSEALEVLKSNQIDLMLLDMEMPELDGLEALELLKALDVGHRARAQPSELSGGEQQRVSIARALANQPPVILADEPTAPLDSERALSVMRILNQMAVQQRTAIIVVTHDEKIIPTFKRIYHIRDGKTYEESGQGLSLD